MINKTFVGDRIPKIPPSCGSCEKHLMEKNKYEFQQNHADTTQQQSCKACGLLVTSVCFDRISCIILSKPGKISRSLPVFSSQGFSKSLRLGHIQFDSG
jgi:hypothetical protein